jgi:hypothetical protein
VDRCLFPSDSKGAAVAKYVVRLPICRKTMSEPAYFPEERNRALLGVALYAFAGAIGWAYSPRVALVIYMTLPVFYGITSEGQTETRIVLLLWRRSRPPTP